MKILYTELFRVFRKYPFGITVVLILDILEIIFLSLNPSVIGVCIDRLFMGEYKWIYFLITIQLLLIIVRAANKIYDTKVYERIIMDEYNAYYEKEIEINPDDSQISSRLNLTDEIPMFFETGLVQLISILTGIMVALVFILIYSGFILFIVAIITSMAVCFFTRKFHVKIAKNNSGLQDHDEKREKIIYSRNRQDVRNFTRKILQLRIANSNLDATGYFLTDVLQALLLIFALRFTLCADNYTSGQVFSIITYIMLLNEHISDINEVRVDVYRLMDSVSRLVSNDESE